ncbi:MAG: aldo/keto reductase [Deltaproteobacteria bacterium]|nr:aldo/keto reductase [Deltaproteobacteria bacterium]
MKYRIFGRTGEQASEIGVGTWTMGGMWGPREDREAINSMLCALDQGVNFIDTAAVYGDGHSESLIASAFKEAKKRVFVATKVPPKNFQWPARHDVSVSETFPADHIIKSTEQSLRNLRTDCVDLQQLHVWSDSWLATTDWLDAVDMLKKQGKIRFFGVSINDHEPDSALKMVASGRIDAVQVIYNIFDQTPEEALFPLCQKHNVAVIVRVPFDEGSLAGALTPDHQFHKKDWRRHYFTPERLKETCERVDKLKFLVRDEIKTMAQAALKFCLSHPTVSTVIPGMRTKKHVDDNCAVSDGKLLSSEELQELKNHAWFRNFYPVW